MKISPIPQGWINCVLTLLKDGDPSKIEWTLTAQSDWAPFGLEQDAYALLIKTLSAKEVLGNAVVGMLCPKDMSYTDAWEFLCPHPWGTPIPLYAKIGVHHSQVHINLISLHVDDGRAKLQTAIQIYQKKKRK